MIWGLGYPMDLFKVHNLINEGVTMQTSGYSSHHRIPRFGILNTPNFLVCETDIPNIRNNEDT